MQLHIAEPCHEDWERMTPAQRGRHCAACDKTVVDVASLTPAAATGVLREIGDRIAGGERVCVRCHADDRGRLRRPGPRRYLLSNALAAMLAMAAADGLAAGEAAGEPVQQPAPARELMGKPMPNPAPQPERLGRVMAGPAPVTDAASGIIVSGRGRILVGSRDSQELWRVETTGTATIARLALDGSAAVAVLADGTVSRHDLASGRVLADAGAPRAVKGDAKVLAPAPPPMGVVCPAPEPAPRPAAQPPAAGAGSDTGLRAAPDGREIWRSVDGKLIWRVRAGGPVASLRAEGAVAEALRLDGVRERYDLASGKLLDVVGETPELREHRAAQERAEAEARERRAAQVAAEARIRAEMAAIADRNAKQAALDEGKRQAERDAERKRQQERAWERRPLEQAGAPPQPVTDAATGISVRADGATLIATRSGAELWRVDVVAALGRPGVGNAAIRSLALQGDEIVFVYGKHRSGSAFLASGALRLIGED